MVTFLFWNLKGKRLEAMVAAFANQHDVDVVILAENQADSSAVLSALNNQAPSYFYVPAPGCERIQIFTRFSDQLFPPLAESTWWSIRRLELPGLDPVLVAAVHLLSKLRNQPSDQLYAARQLSEEIRRVERDEGHARTVVVGDLNLDPFDEGLVSADALHAVSSRRVAARRERIVQSMRHPFFYNPMWNYLGDARPGPPGTYYYGSGLVAHFWHAFDQVLVRPDLVSRFDAGSVSILENDGTRSLLRKNGTPDDSRFSDHLPLVFRLSL
jgi:hypothetical protein